MRALILSNGELVEREIENTLEELQNLVEGHIELPYLSERFRRNGINIIGLMKMRSVWLLIITM